MLRNQPYAGTRRQHRTDPVRQGDGLMLRWTRSRASPRAFAGCEQRPRLHRIRLRAAGAARRSACAGSRPPISRWRTCASATSPMLTADNASRVRDSIDEANVIELLTGAKMSGDNIDFRRTAGSSCPASSRTPPAPAAPRPASGSAGSAATASRMPARVTADRAPARADATLQSVGTAGNTIAASSGTAVMVVEVVYDYQPMFPTRSSGRPKSAMKAPSTCASAPIRR